MNLDQFLSEIKYEKQFLKLKKKLKDKKVVIYGSGQLFQLINEQYDLSDINIIAISDGKYTEEDRGKEFLGYKIVPLVDIAALRPDYIVVAILNYIKIIDNFENNVFKNTKIKIIPLAQKNSSNLLAEIAKEDNFCTGCSACMNVCPCGAITMKQDGNGFYKPSVDKEKCTNCGMCEKVCPIINSKSFNNPTPPLYVFNNYSKEAKKSAAAGGFQILAKHFIANGGKVVGASWDKNWKCVHVLVNNDDDLKKLYKSKYVQCYMNYIYEQVKSELESGVKILFSGLPCQIAGLYSFLNKKYENLYTVDLLCNNAPSQKHFDKFLEEYFGQDNITEVDFRYKSLSESIPKQMVMKVSLQNGQEFYSNVCQDIHCYYNAFVQRLLVGAHCEHCHFARLPRVADITLGDIFGAEAIDKRFVGLKSESVLINSEKGKYLFNVIKSNVDEIIKIPLEILLSMHPVLTHMWDVHPSRNRMFDLLKRYSFKKASDYVFNDKYDIGVVGIPTNPNFGGGLTYLALKWTLEDMGKTVLMISPPGADTPWLPKKITNFKNNPYKHYELVCYHTKNSMNILNYKCDMFLTGSDQLYSTHFFNSGIYTDIDEFSSLDWVWDSKKKAAYSASFGQDDLICPIDIKNRMSYYLRQFDSFSVRERSAVDLCKKEFNMDVPFVLDPIFLCDKDRYKALIKNGRKISGIAKYILDSDDEKEKIVQEVSERFSYQINNIEDAALAEDKMYMEDWLAMYDTSNFVITDSFHGTCFAIIFNKPFIVFANKNRGLARFKILEEFGLMNRLVESFEDYELRKDEIYSSIDWDSVNKKINSLKESSLEILKTAISQKQKFPSTYDILNDKIIDLRVSNEKYQNEIIKLSKDIHNLKESKFRIFGKSKSFDGSHKIIHILGFRLKFKIKSP